MIPDEAIESAARAIYESESYLNKWDWPMAEFDRDEYRKHARAALEAAAPHLLAAAWQEGHLNAVMKYAPSPSSGVVVNPYRAAGAGE